MQKTEIEPIAIRVGKAARLLGVSQRTVQHWAANGKIPHRRIGKVIFFSPAQLREWAAGRLDGESSQG